MGTHSLVKFKDSDSIFTAVHHQYDGYYEGVGLDLANWLLTKNIFNVHELCYLATQYIQKCDANTTYIAHPDTEEVYEYIVSFKNDKFYITFKYFDEYDFVWQRLTPEQYIQKFKNP
jgi:hypothetical protein